MPQHEKRHNKETNRFTQEKHKETTHKNTKQTKPAGQPARHQQVVRTTREAPKAVRTTREAPKSCPGKSQAPNRKSVSERLNKNKRCWTTRAAPRGQTTDTNWRTRGQPVDNPRGTKKLPGQPWRHQTVVRTKASHLKVVRTKSCAQYFYVGTR